MRPRTTRGRTLLTFFSQCAQDPRFNASEILAQVGNATKPSLADRLLYRYVLILRTKKALTDPGKVIFALEVHARNPQAGWQGYRRNE